VKTYIYHVVFDPAIQWKPLKVPYLYNLLLNLNLVWSFVTSDIITVRTARIPSLSIRLPFLQMSIEDLTTKRSFKSKGMIG
jgi:hypothetical protein